MPILIVPRILQLTKRRQGREKGTAMESVSSITRGIKATISIRRTAEFVANANARGNNKRYKGKPPQSGGSGPSLEQLLNEPCPKYGTRERPATHLWKDCAIMKAFKNSNTFDGGQGSGGGSGAGGFHGPGGGSNSGFQGQPGGMSG